MDTKLKKFDMKYVHNSSSFETTKQKSDILKFHETFLISGMAATMSKTAAAPIERIKLLMQNQNEMIKQGCLKRPYSGILDCAKVTFSHEGLMSFWRGRYILLLFHAVLTEIFKYKPQHPCLENVFSILGNLVNVMRYSCTQAFNFSFKDSIKHRLFGDPSSNVWKRSQNYEKLGKNIISGGVAGSCSLTFVYSLDYCRTRLANDIMSGTGEKRKFNGIIDVYVKTIR